MYFSRDVDDVAEIVGKVACQSIEVLAAPSVVDVGNDDLGLGHVLPHHNPNQASMGHMALASGGSLRPLSFFCRLSKMTGVLSGVFTALEGLS
jgi:hypothetical protein